MKILEIILDKINEMPKFPAQILLSGLLSVAPAIPISLMDRLTGWYINNQWFLTIVFLAVLIDYLLGTIVHWKVKADFSAGKNLGGLLKKGFSVCAGYVLFEMVHQIVSDVEFIAIYFKVVLQLSVLLYPTLSALKNLSILSGGEFPPAIWFKKFESFNRDLDLNNFKTTKNDSENNDAGPDDPIDIMPEQEEKP
ncbi:phage holin family protein [Chryseobacterium sp. MP_3.2]|uniref:phage holin family protein n=1 Tax=Chryseobacterium sp. MP_3.2 TaxID=3071712 RepID=UPI002DF81926|nr:hypothetical protein [Chryseobacterium sp. MP_3.2]